MKAFFRRTMSIGRQRHVISLLRSPARVEWKAPRRLESDAIRFLESFEKHPGFVSDNRKQSTSPKRRKAEKGLSRIGEIIGWHGWPAPAVVCLRLYAAKALSNLLANRVGGSTVRYNCPSPWTKPAFILPICFAHVSKQEVIMALLVIPYNPQLRR